MFDEDVSRAVAQPAGGHLFKTNENAEKLDEETADIFHTIVAKLLWIMKRARPDIEPAVSFLCTRVQAPDVDDKKKLRQLLRYLQATIADKRIMRPDSLTRVFTWIDAAYGVHHDARSHTGGCMSMGWGMIHCKSSRQKLNTKSSTEAEVIGMSDYIPYVIWMMYFMEAQGYPLNKNVVFQDNMSAIKMEKNGRNLCTGNSKHIHARYFFVKDRVSKKEIEIEYCPTGDMIADYFTKPLHGSQFVRLRRVIMGWNI